MITDIRVMTSPQHDPYRNLAIEYYLLRQVAEGQCILYLWRNSRCVVVGANQLAMNECDIEALEKDGGFLVRRKSGGGAVYHDLGNLNFTFLMPSVDFDEARQSEVILRALHSLGLDCLKSGRNDLTIDGRKFSGHAYYHHDGHSYHHGTIMLEVKEQELAKYLHVSKLKLRDKHVRSVRSRVINLKQLKPQLTVEELSQSLISSFEEVYGLKAGTLSAGELDERKIGEYRQMFASPEWKYDRQKIFQYSRQAKYDWGIVRIDYDLNGGIISDCAVYSDSLQADYLARAAGIIRGKSINALSDYLNDREHERINEDIIALLSGKEQS
ncbi:MAG: lipoate--protein ligase [Erysipelotrichaceae bacterium]|nr:lipoate--protein ligase [Erysipelotrichaceae bacterium]